ALLIGNSGIALVSGRMRAGAEQPRSGPDQRAAHIDKLAYRVPDSPVNARDELDLARVQLPLDLSRHLAQPLKHSRRAVDLPPGNRVNQKKLLLDPNRKRLP